MLQFRNQTPFAGTIYILPDEKGVDCAYAVVKATFTLSAQLRLAELQEPPANRDQYYGDPTQSSLRSASDITLTKPATDVLLQGLAYAPRGKAPHTDVALTLGSAIRKTIRVFGDRVWDSGGLPGSITPPKPFEAMPLTWERAFGGSTEPRNPVGCGLEDARLPNIETPSQFVSSRRDRPAPAGVGPIPGHWEPRRLYAGTYDEVWQKKRAPYLPENFDSRFFQLAPADQIVPGYLQGGEPVRVNGCTPDGDLSFFLPSIRVQIRYRFDTGDQVCRANLDTVTIDTNAMRLHLVWRSALPCDKRALKIREVEANAS